MNFIDKKQILTSFLAEGYQLDESALDFLTSHTDQIVDVLGGLQKLLKKPAILTDKHIKTLLNPQTPITLKTPQHVSKPPTPNTILSLLSNRYNFLKSVLQNRLELTNLASINKIGGSKQFSLIALLREVDYVDKNIIAEDKTGSIKLFFDDQSTAQHLVSEETVGLLCMQEEGRIKIQRVVHPDIPIKREIIRSKTKTTCVFFPAQTLNELRIHPKHYAKYEMWCKDNNSDNTVVFVLGGIPNPDVLGTLPKQSTKIVLVNETPQGSDDDSELIIMVEPALVKIGGVTLFLSTGDFLKDYITAMKTNAEEALVNLLKKRHLNPTFNIQQPIYSNDPYLLDIIPDVIVVGSSGTPQAINYKGVTIVTTGSPASQPIVWSTDLQTRETIKIDFT
jgi:predicted phosphodiesterase